MTAGGIKRAYTLLAAACCIAMLCISCYGNSYGATAGNTMEFFSITSSQQGLITTAQAVGGVVTTVLLALFGERFNKLRLCMVGLGLIVLSSFAVGTMTLYCLPGSGYALLLCYTCVGGVGISTLDIMVSGAIPEVYPEKSVTLIPLVHAFYGVGAVASTFFISQMLSPQRPQDFTVPFLAFGALGAVALCILIPSGEKLRPVTVYADMSEAKRRARGNPAEIFKTGKAWLILIAALLFTGFATGLMAWVPTYCRTELMMDSRLAGLMLTLFFVGSLVTRFVLPLLLRKVRLITYIGVSGLAAVAAMAGFLLTRSPAATAVMITLVGIATGGYVPGMFMYAAASFPQRTASASSVVVMAQSLSVLLAPFVMGRIAELASFFTALVAVTVCLLLSAILALVLRSGDLRAQKQQ